MTPGDSAETRRRTPLLALLAANGVSVTGDMMARLALPWFALQTTGSPARTGVVAAAMTVPVVLAGIFGGAAVDRMGHRRASIWSDWASGATTALIPLLYLSVGLPFWLLVALVFTGSLLDAPGRAARRALYPRLVNLAGTPMERATGAYDGVDRLALLLGGPLAGALAALLGPANVLWVNAATFAVSALLTAGLVPADDRAQEHSARSAAYLDDLKAGIGYMVREPLIRTIILIVIVTNALDGTTEVTTPVYADRFLAGAADLGLLMGALGLGALTGAALFGLGGHRLPHRIVLAVAMLVLGGRFAAYALGLPLPPLLAITFVAGLAAGPINPIWQTLQYARVPEHLRGRVFAAFGAAVMAAAPLGTLAAGYLTDLLGVRAVFATCALLYVGPAITPLWHRAFRTGPRGPRPQQRATQL